MSDTPLQFFAPFDGSDLAVGALERAATLADGTPADVVVATVVSRDRGYAGALRHLPGLAGRR